MCHTATFATEPQRTRAFLRLGLLKFTLCLTLHARPMFTEADQARVAKAVSDAEELTSGEIVPYVVRQSGRYEAAVWRGAAVWSVLVLLVTMLVHQFYDGWGLGWLFSGWGVAATVVTAGSLGALITAFVPPVKRLMAGPNTLAERVHLRSMRAFVEEEVFLTRDRTGILLFVSLLEHRIEVLGDEGINAKVSADDWVHVVERIQAGISKNDLADGLIGAIGLCGELLERKGVEIRKDDEDELSNRVRFRDE